jgi:hypothetical protein
VAKRVSLRKAVTLQSLEDEWLNKAMANAMDMARKRQSKRVKVLHRMAAIQRNAKL